MTVTEAPDLVTALLGVPGVAAAAVEPASSGPGTLRLQLVPGADEVGVAGAVNRMLRSRFGLAVDADRVRVLGEPPLKAAMPTTPTTTTNGGGRAEVHATTLRAEVAVEPPPVVRPDGPPVAAPAPVPVAPPARRTAEPAAPAVPSSEPEPWQPTPRRPVAAQPAARPDQPAPQPAGPAPQPGQPDRAVPRVEQQASTRLQIERVQLASAGLTTSVVVSLRHDGRVVDGRADGTATAGSLHRSVAHATLRAVEQVLGNGVRFDLEHVEIARTGTERTALVVVTMVTERAQQRLSGASVVREDVRQAAIRAVLAAVNRRVEPLIGAGQGNLAE